MKYIKVIWQDIRNGQNLDVYITVSLSIIVGILGILGIVNQIIISAAVLATLALVSVSLLQNRRENDVIQNAIIKIGNESKPAQPFLQHELSSYLEQNQLLVTTQKVFFWGLTFERMIPHIRNMLEQRLQSGLDVRFLILQPNSTSVKMAAFRDTYQDENRINTILRTTLLDLSTIARKAVSPAKLEVRVVDYLPSWTIMAFDPQKPNGQIFVSLLSFRDINENRVSFKLDAIKDGEWIRIFRDQFESLWEVAQPVNILEGNGFN